MIKYLGLILILVANLGQAQDLKKVKEKLGWKEYAKYTVLKSDRSVKHGWYKRYSWKELVEEGNYVNGVKEGEWKLYHGNNEIKATGTYHNDKKNGEWVFYEHNGAKEKEGTFKEEERVGEWSFYENGKLLQKYDYTQKELLYSSDQGTDTMKVIIMVDGEEVKSTLDRAPMFLGGESELMEFIQDHLEYPQHAVEFGEQGIVYVSFFIDVDGSVDKIKILRGVSESLDEESIRVIKASSGHWIPGLKDGEKVKTQYVIPIHYRLG